MSGALFLGWRYLVFHQLKTIILVASITLMLFLPAATRVLVNDSAAALTSRADQTPLLVGASGSPLELVLSSLYFHAEQPAELPFASFEELRNTGWADAIPLNTRFHSRGSPIVGTSLDYFRFRNLKLSEGRLMGMLGECVIGANVAARQSVGVGYSLVSSPETVFDIAGVYPLKMAIAGVLKPNGSADDDAIFVDYKTTWVIQGLGHGHQDLAKPAAASQSSSGLHKKPSTLRVLTGTKMTTPRETLAPPIGVNVDLSANTDDFDVAALTDAERDNLQSVLSWVPIFQNRLSYDFLGVAGS